MVVRLLPKLLVASTSRFPCRFLVRTNRGVRALSELDPSLLDYRQRKALWQLEQALRNRLEEEEFRRWH